MSKVKLGDVAIEHKETCGGSKDGYPIVGLEHLTPEEVTLTAWDEDSDNTFTKVFRKGNVLFGRRRAYLRKAAVAPFDGICSGDITVIEAIPDRILPELLPFIIQNDGLFSFAVGKSAGSLSPRVKWEHLKNYEFELPSMDRQRELAELLWAMDTTKKSYQKLIAATDELVKSQFIDMFGDWRTNTSGFPEMKLGTITDVGSSKRVFVSELQTAGIPFYRGTEIGALATGAEITPDLYISEDHYESLKKATGIPSIGDLLMPSICPDGRIWQVPSTKPFYFKDGRVLWIHMKSNVLNSTFLQYLLKQIFSTSYENIASGTTFVELKIFNLKDLTIMVPDIELQKQFELFVRQSDKSKFELEQALAELNATYKRIIAENLG